MAILPRTLIAFALLAPLAVAHHEGGLTLTHARLTPIFDPLDEVGSRYEIVFTWRNDGAPGIHRPRVDELWVIVDLPYTRWWQDVHFAAGESRTFTARVEYPFLNSLPIPGPSWLCAENGATPELDYARCWSVWAGTAMPDGAYPETIPHWQVPDVPMGDTP